MFFFSFLHIYVCRYGPLVRFWCMRFEGKHNMFKDLAHRVKNFKNIPKTMAFRHQELVCYYFNSDSDRSPFCKKSRTGPGTWMYTESLWVIMGACNSKTIQIWKLITTAWNWILMAFMNVKLHAPHCLWWLMHVFLKEYIYGSCVLITPKCSDKIYCQYTEVQRNSTGRIFWHWLRQSVNKVCIMDDNYN